MVLAIILSDFVVIVFRTVKIGEKRSEQRTFVRGVASAVNNECTEAASHTKSPSPHVKPLTVVRVGSSKGGRIKLRKGAQSINIKKKATLQQQQQRRVNFPPSVVTAVYTRPHVKPSIKPILHYSRYDIRKFRVKYGARRILQPTPEWNAFQRMCHQAVALLARQRLLPSPSKSYRHTVASKRHMPEPTLHNSTDHMPDKAHRVHAQVCSSPPFHRPVPPSTGLFKPAVSSSTFKLGSVKARRFISRSTKHRSV